MLRTIPRIHGTVTDADGAPLVRRELTVWEGELQRHRRYTQTDGRGRFSFDAEEGAVHTLVVYAGGDFPGLIRRGIRASLDPLDLRLEDFDATRGTVAGRVVGPDGDPVSAEVYVEHSGWARASI